MRKKNRQGGEIALALIIGLAVGSGFLIAKKDDQRKQANLPHGQTTTTWEDVRPTVMSGAVEIPTPARK